MQNAKCKMQNGIGGVVAEGNCKLQIANCKLQIWGCDRDEEGSNVFLTAKRSNSKAQGREAHPGLTGRVSPAPRRGATVRGEHWLLCFALLAVAGCSKYGPDTIRTGTGGGATPLRTPEQIMNESLKVLNDLETTIRGVKDRKAAMDAVPKAKNAFDRLALLAKESGAVEKTLTPEENKKLDAQFEPQGLKAVAALMAALGGLSKIPGLPPDLMKTVADGLQKMQQAEADAKNAPAPPPSEVLPDKPPAGSCWVVWLLCAAILAACAGFLYRDGLWSNAIRLVNVILAGLLTMNFYEPLARWITNYSDDIHAFIPFLDFLVMWVLFVLAAKLFLTVTDAVSKVRVRFLKVVDTAGGIALSLAIGWVMMGFTLTTLHAAPLGQYPLMGSFRPNESMFFLFAPDREWLGFTRYQSLGNYCRAVDKPVGFPPNFIETQLTRRMHIEKYMDGTQKILVNKDLMTKKPAKPAGN